MSSSSKEPEPASSSTPKESTSQDQLTEKTEARKKAVELLAQGKRNMVCGEIPKAVSMYEEAVKILVDNCGELSYDCADAYFNCGSALLELGRLENTVLGAALHGVDVEEEKEESTSEQFEKPPEDEEEREKLRKQVYEAMSEEDRGKADKFELDPKGKDGAEVAAKEDNDKNAEAEKNEGDGGSKMETSPADAESEKGDGSATVEKSQKQNSTDDVKDEKNSEVKENSKNVENKENTKGKKDIPAPTEDCLKDIINTVSTETKDKTKGKDDTETKDNTKAKDCTEAKEACDKGNEEKEAAVSPKKGDKVEKAEASASKEETKSDSLPENKEQSKDGEAAKSPAKDTQTGDKDTSTTSKDGKADKENGEEEPEQMETENDGDANEGEDADTVEDEDEEAVDDEDMATGEEGGQGEETEKGGDDVGNFQLAWEHLDLAKVIYQKSEGKEDQLKAAECYLKLGELSMETELHEQAAEDLLSALKIQEKHLEADDRIIAETHYTLGLAFGLGKDFEKSIIHYQGAVTVIEARIASLMKLVEEEEVPENKENQQDDPLKKYKDEIKDLRELVPEMQNKIEDAKVEQRDMAQMMEMAKAALGLSRVPTGFASTLKTDAGVSSSSSSQKVDENGERKASDIAHLVRKKRKPEEENAPPEVDSKKICKEVKGDDVTSEEKKEEKKEETVNGHVEKPEEKGATAAEPMAS